MNCQRCGREAMPNSPFCDPCVREIAFQGSSWRQEQGGQQSPQYVPPYPPYGPAPPKIYPLYPQDSFRKLAYGYLACCGALIFITFGYLLIMGSQLTPDQMQNGPAFNHPVFLLAMVGFSLLSNVLSIGMMIFWGFFIYRSWTVIQDGPEGDTHPGLAVALCFVPFFNFYWLFIAFPGLARRMNDYCRRRQIISPSAPYAWAMAMCIFGIIVASLSIPLTITMMLPFVEWPYKLVAIACQVVLSLLAFLIAYKVFTGMAGTAETITQYKVSQARYTQAG